MKIKKSILLLALVILLAQACIPPQKSDTISVNTKVDFSATLQEWDGFGVNYVELAQSTDPISDPQEYSGFSRLNEKQRQEILEMIFGEDGLQPNIVKMFLDPFHQKAPDEPFDHESTTEWMRYFVHQGIAKNGKRGGQDIEIITTLYGPPAWATQQKILRGRDLDPLQYENLAHYMIDWLRYLIKKEKLPVKYLSLHNEGDSPDRWPLDGSHGNIGTGGDYNAFWRPTQVAHFLEFMPSMIKAAGLDVGLTPGECTTWKRMSDHWYHWAVFDNKKAFNQMALITSHGFGKEKYMNSQANNLFRLERPELHAWTTSMTWGGRRNMKDFDFLDVIRRNIYHADVNAVIPWAVLQTLTWVGGDPNPGTAFFISEEGEYEVKPQYYYYKQLCRAGQRGMKVATVATEKDSGIELIAFASNGTKNSDAFLVLNLTDNDKEVVIEINGANAPNFVATRSSETEKYVDIKQLKILNGNIIYQAPAGSVTTFTAIQ